MLEYPNCFRQPSGPTISPLLLSDRLLSLAQDADKAGYRVPAKRLLRAALEILDEPEAMKL
jgi:hypothetical protein